MCNIVWLLDELTFHCSLAGFFSQFPFCRKMLNLLLVNNALTDIQGKLDGKSSLHISIEHNHKDCVIALLDAGANPNLPDAKGCTPLHYGIDLYLLIGK